MKTHAAAMISRYERLRSQLRVEESLRLVVYDDKTGRPLQPGMTLKGHPTIGYGRALDVNGVTREEADRLLERDIAEKWAAVGLIHGAWFDTLDDVRKVAVVDMAFTLGAMGLAKLTRFVKAMSRGDYHLAARYMLETKWRRDVGDTRATRLSRMIAYGEWPEDISHDGDVPARWPLTD